jgi:hypothetical protein
MDLEPLLGLRWGADASGVGNLRQRCRFVRMTAACLRARLGVPDLESRDLVMHFQSTWRCLTPANRFPQALAFRRGRRRGAQSTAICLASNYTVIGVPSRLGARRIGSSDVGLMGVRIALRSARCASGPVSGVRGD